MRQFQIKVVRSTPWIGTGGKTFINKSGEQRNDLIGYPLKWLYYLENINWFSVINCPQV